MCTGIEAIAAGVSTAASVGGSIMNFGAQNKAAWEQRAHNAKLEAINEKYRAEVIQYQNVVYQQEVDHGGKMLEHQRSEFDRQGRMVENATVSIQKNLFAKYGQLLQRQIEEGMAAAFDLQANEKAGMANRAKAQVAADAKGIEGSSVEQLIDDVSRQQGDNETVLNLNRSATMRQLTLEAMGLKASADQALYNIPIQTYAPVAPINPPSPVNPVRPEAPVASPNRGAMIANVIGAGVQGVSNYATWSGKKMSDVFSFK
jgi:hypothetical protein